MRLVFLISIFSEFLARMALYFRTEGVYDLDDMNVFNFLMQKDVMIQGEPLFITMPAPMWETCHWGLVLIFLNVHSGTQLTP